MKTIKMLVIALLSVMTIAANAAVTAKAKISVTSTGGGSDVLYLVEGTDYTADYDMSADAEKIMNSGQSYNINLYAVIPGHDLSMICTNDLTNIPLTFQSNTTETAYTMTFSSVTGTIKLFDAVTGTETVLANSGTYDFTCAANQPIADRFFINYVPAAPQICHRDGKLQVTGMKNSNVVVKNMDDSATTIGTVAITDDYQEITLKSVIAAGQYKVEYNDGTAHTVIIDVQ